MVTKVRLQFFKRFPDQEFVLDDAVVLAGPNNCGKSTLLQGIAVWHLAVQRWLAERWRDSSKARERTGIPISRKDFTAIPLREMNLLWTDRDTAYGKDEVPGKNPGDHKLISIGVWGTDATDGSLWHVTTQLRYTNKEQIYAKLTDESGTTPLTDVPAGARELQVVHVPPFSGIGAEETRYDRGYQNLLIGQGKPGDILRNLLLEVSKTPDAWRALRSDVQEVLGCNLLDPVYSEADPYIVVEYLDPAAHSRKPLDIASAGSGFHQVLTLLSFFHARSAAILLLDEPDAHQHVILQRQVFDRVRKVARERQCQLLVSTHSEVLLQGTEPERIVSFYGDPHRLLEGADRDRLREALARLSALDILNSESGKNVLYVENEGDLKIMLEWARVIGHPFVRFDEGAFSWPLAGLHPREAKGHFFALQAIRPTVKGVLLLDGDARQLPEHEVTAAGLVVLRWRRYEVESYLVQPALLVRFVGGGQPDLFAAARGSQAEEFLRNELPPAVLREPLSDHDYLLSVAASKTLLPSFFRHVGRDLPKKDYYQLAGAMRPDEVHPEINEKLDEIARALGVTTPDAEEAEHHT